MRVLLTTIGTRGEVQPMVALALQLRDLGQEVCLCVPPDFREWIEGLGFVMVALGPPVQPFAAARGSAKPSPEQLRRLGEESVATQFETLSATARGCDAIVAGGGLLVAARSVAETLGIAYVYTAFCPVTLPSPHHAPPLFRLRGDAAPQGAVDPRALWEQDAQRWNAGWSAVLNTHRASAGLPPVSDVRSHIFGTQPWLAADPKLGPWLATTDLEVVQTGAWLVRDTRPLSPEIEAFLAAGEPPVYFGFGSIGAPENVSDAMIQASRALGRRAIVLRGWAGLTLADDARDCIAIVEVNQQALFPRVAAIVHHGGAGTTTAATRAGVPQVVVPQMFDQFYWADRVRRLGIGTTHPPIAPTADSLLAALRDALEPDVGSRARSFAPEIQSDGAERAALRLLAVKHG